MVNSRRDDKFFIYPKNKKGERTGHTICVLLKNGYMFHGEALCSQKDQFSRKKGIQLSLERAEEAYKNFMDKHVKE